MAADIPDPTMKPGMPASLADHFKRYLCLVYSSKGIIRPSFLGECLVESLDGPDVEPSSLGAEDCHLREVPSDDTLRVYSSRFRYTVHPLARGFGDEQLHNFCNDDLVAIFLLLARDRHVTSQRLLSSEMAEKKAPRWLPLEANPDVSWCDNMAACIPRGLDVKSL